MEEVHVLEDATEKGDIQTLRRILEEGDLDLNVISPDSHRLLITALLRGYFDIATLLINHGVPVNCRSDSGWTPLHIAAGDPAAWELIKVMLELGADVNAEISINSVADFLSEEAGDTPLHRATVKGNLEIVKLLLEHGADCNKTNTHITSPLIIAVKGQWVEITRVLLEHDADVGQYSINPPSLWCLTPLDWAMYQLFALLGGENLCKIANFFLNWELENISEVVKIIPTEVEVNAADIESMEHLLTIIELLVMKGAYDNVIIQTMKFRNPEESHQVAKVLIEYGAKLDVEDQRGISLMQVAACIGYYDLVKLFLENGAEWDCPNHCGWTPLMISLAGFREVDINVCKLFVEYGANVNAQDDKGKTPLMIAIPGYTTNVNHYQIIKYLIEQGAEVNVADSDGDTPLSSALRFQKREDSDEIIQLLLDSGANVNTKNSEGNTPLHIAISKYDRVGFKVVKLLLDFKAEVNARDSEGNTPLMLAIMHCYFSNVTQLLIEKGADVNVKNDNGKTPFTLAVLESRSDIISKLLMHKVKFDPKSLLEDETLVHRILGTIPFKRKEVLGIHRMSNRVDVRETRKSVVNNYIQKRFSEKDAALRGRMFVALHEGLRDSPTEMKCITGLGASALLFTIVENHILEMILHDEFVSESNLESVISYRLKHMAAFKYYHLACIKEINFMEKFVMSDSVTLYDIMTKDPKKVAMYARNDNISRQMLKVFSKGNSNGSKLYFPVFKFLIYKRILNAISRKKLLQAGASSLNYLLTKFQTDEYEASRHVPINKLPHKNEPSLLSTLKKQSCLPTVVSDSILDLLSDEDLQNMILSECGVTSCDIKKLQTQWGGDLMAYLIKYVY